MLLTLQLDPSQRKDREVLRAILTIHEAADTDIASSHRPIEIPPTVTCYTSRGNEELAKSQLNVADTIGVEVKTVDKPDVGKVKEAAEKLEKTVKKQVKKTKKAKAKSANEPLITDEPVKKTEPAPAKVEVKTEKVEAKGSIDEALDALDVSAEETITEDEISQLRAWRVEAAKLGKPVINKYFEVVQEEHGQLGKFYDITRAAADKLLPRIKQLIADAKEGKEPEKKTEGDDVEF